MRAGTTLCSSSIAFRAGGALGQAVHGRKRSAKGGGKDDQRAHQWNHERDVASLRRRLRQWQLLGY